MLTILAVPVAAHSTPNSEVRFSEAKGMVIAEITVPRGEYAFGTGNAVDGSELSLRLARDYLAAHIAVSTPGGRPWAVTFRKVEFIQLDGPADLHAVAELIPPGGASSEKFTLEWKVLIETLPGHFTIFLLDSEAGGADNGIVGTVKRGMSVLDIDMAGPSGLDSFTSAIGLGAHHILEGYDHLLFLLVLLLPAPLVVSSGDWSGNRRVGSTIVKLVHIVTAFTIGHSLTLIAATLGRWSLPSAPVEVAIAISVLVSAMHASRPILPGKEPLIALIFGFVHGLAFATLVQEAHVGVATGVLTLLGFNVGIELVQLAIVALVVPSLLVFARYRFYHGLRQTLAYLSIVAAMAWIVNRTTGLAEGLVANLEATISHLGLAAVVAALLALFLTVRDRVATKEGNVGMEGASA